MITIADTVRTWLARNPTLTQYIQEGLINHSSLARRIKPEVERQIGEIVSVEAITLALNRHAKRLAHEAPVDYAKYIGEVSVQSGLSVLTLPQTDKSMGEFFAVARQLHDQNEYMVYTRGLWYTALIGRSEIVDELAATLQGTITSRDCVGITVKLRIGHLPIPGVCAYVLQLLASRGINLVEVTSSHNELTVFVESRFTSDALSLLVTRPST